MDQGSRLSRFFNISLSSCNHSFFKRRFTKIQEYADLISNHGIFITNSTSQPQVYKVELLLACGIGIRDEIFYAHLNPGGTLTNQYQMAMSEEVDTPGIYDIKVFTKIEGIENNFMELHYKFYARQ